ncbi:hypothetical protein ASPWEDRAFT_102930 [Aspergillus wentii DTO 134E9]|uniref:Xaa-Pro dipeptidyl-peptidase-like domain-containing protein n=1 Tax=Aspergillus wentii DTO 134E9 TaxID=1073089 RepID=A0A1L9S1I5_ASPWE|nr:uncharacterized protein ASPWEDRAFT_102930 [Aspergillus wentii DTO 134E9]KAI9931013.1 hypothetical protein MW887_010668 [Aspergillus wentii]OJJ40993.1 hypothetical protein ASPWEDRAFT_102930 [Aspergillus wentii DTO 134E9]
MHLSSPTFEFFVPSVYDGTQLDCRIYLPREFQRLESASSWQKRGAIVAHPYASLGGCYDDPVVGFVGGELLKAGYVVLTFNFRGAGESEGRTSWTAKPELADYVSIYGFILRFLHGLRVKSLSTQADDLTANSENSTADVRIILGGYSYGSLIASHLPKIDVIMELFRKPSDGTVVQEICKVAENIAASSIEKLRTRVEMPTLGKSSFTDDGMNSTKITKPAISYLLISPLLPPVSFFLTVFSKLSLDVGVGESSKQIPCPKPADQLCANRSLAIYGNQDTFTSASKLHKWSGELCSDPRSNLQCREIDGAGHFWREKGVEAQARDTLRNWLRQMP